MKPISSSRRLVIGKFVLRLSSSRHLSTSNPSSSGFHHHHQHQSRRHQEEESSRNVKVFVWWDFENCQPPVGSNAYRVSHNITAALRSNGMKGPVQITAFGDVLQLSRSNQVALSATGIVLNHVPQGGKNSADRSLLMDLMYWVSQNPPPAHLFLVSCDRDFASMLHRLRMNNYNILLASRDDASDVLCSAASIMWDWTALIKGESLTGKHFNQPPDGPYGSWYGHYRVPIEDPFAVSKQPGCMQSRELSKSNSEAKPRLIPRKVVHMIRSILKSNRQGISMLDLRMELGNNIDKDLYGYKKFSHFLLSMPHILTIESIGNGCYNVHGVAPKVSEIGESSVPISPGPATTNTESLDSTVSSKRPSGDISRKGAGPIINTENLVSTVSSVKMGGDSSSKINGRDMSCKGAWNEKSSSPSSSKSNTKECLTELQEPLKEVTETQSHVQCSSKRPSGDISRKGAGPIINTENLVSTVSSVKMGGDSSSKINGRDMSCKGAWNEKSSSPSSSKSNTKECLTELQEPLKEMTETQSHVQCSSPLVEKESNVEVKASQLHPAAESCLTPEVGVLKRIWNKWLRGDDESEVESHANIGKHFTPRENADKINHEVQCVESIVTSPDRVGQSASSSSKAGLTSSSNEIIVDEVTNSSSVVSNDKPGNLPGIFSRIMSWYKFRKTDQDSESLNEEVGGRKSKRGINLEIQEMFSESLWNDVLAFLKTPKGSESILQSKTRKEMVQNLQKQGPSSLLSLTEAHLFHLVDLLISDKHWVEESTAQAFPFKLVLPAGKSSQKNPASRKESSSILSHPESKLESKLGQPEKDGEKRCGNLPHNEATSRSNKPADKSRARVLGDCQKLVNELLKEYPDGYNMSEFRRLFLDRYGYFLDVRKLGYQKLASLLQIMPGVKIESTFIFPSERVLKVSSTDATDPNVIQGSTNSRRKDLKSDRELSKKDDDDSDSPWEELGPVAANSGPKRSNEIGLSRVVKEESAGPQMLHNYETISCDYESSDSEEEMLSLRGGSEGQGIPGKNEEQSSLLEILDSKYGIKEDSRRAAASTSKRAADGMVDCSTSGVKPSSPSARKQSAPKTYSFVADKPGDKKDKLIDVILGSLKKSRDGLSESRI